MLYMMKTNQNAKIIEKKKQTILPMKGEKI